MTDKHLKWSTNFAESHIDRCASVWSSTTKQLQRKIEIAQKNALKAIADRKAKRPRYGFVPEILYSDVYSALKHTRRYLAVSIEKCRKGWPPRTSGTHAPWSSSSPQYITYENRIGFTTSREQRLEKQYSAQDCEFFCSPYPTNVEMYFCSILSLESDLLSD